MVIINNGHSTFLKCAGTYMQISLVRKVELFNHVTNTKYLILLLLLLLLLLVLLMSVLKNLSLVEYLITYLKPCELENSRLPYCHTGTGNWREQTE